MYAYMCTIRILIRNILVQLYYNYLEKTKNIYENIVIIKAKNTKHNNNKNKNKNPA